jgi:hypothetical protein
MLYRIRVISLILLAILTALNVFDYHSTVYILKNGGVEMNPFMNWFMGIVGVEMAMAIMKITFIILIGIVIFLIKTEKVGRMFMVCILFINSIYILSLYFTNFQILRVLL